MLKLGSWPPAEQQGCKSVGSFACLFLYLLKLLSAVAELHCLITHPQFYYASERMLALWVGIAASPGPISQTEQAEFYFLKQVSKKTNNFSVPNINIINLRRVFQTTHDSHSFSF